MKILKLLILFVSFLLVTNFVFADKVVTYGEFQNQQKNININYGDQVYFDYTIFSVNPPIRYSVKMYDGNGNLVKTFIDTSTDSNFIEERYYLTQADYVNNMIYDIIIEAEDRNGKDSTILTLQVNPVTVNNPPVLDPIGNKIVNENELLQFFVTATDPDNDVLTLTATNLPQRATFTDLGNGRGEFRWQTNFQDSGTYNVRFSVSDSMLTDFEDVLITVINVNNFPNLIINAPVQNEVISGIYNIRWTANDLDQTANTLDIKIEYSSNGITWQVLEDLQDNNDGIFTWNTNNVADGNYILRISARDNDDNIVSATVNFIIDNTYAPNINILRPRENEIISGIYNILWQATDVDQNDATLDIKIEYKKFRIFGFNPWITLEDLQDNNDGIFTWNTTQVNNGLYSLKITVTDDDNNKAVDVVNLFFIFNRDIIQNNAPIITSTPITNAIVNQLYNYDVEAFDPDNDPLTYSLLVYPLEMSIDANTGLISWIPTSIGNYDVVVQVNDNRNGIVQQTFLITVTEITPPSEPPKVEEFARKHNFMISNIILKQNKNDLNIIFKVDNLGNSKEDIKLIITDLNTGKTAYDNIHLAINEGKFRFVNFKNVKKGLHVVKVEAISKAFKSSGYGYTYIK